VETNVAGTITLLDLCREFGVPRFILASTSSLYGAHNTLPFREDADTNRTLSPYAASKKAAEAMCYTYHYLYGLDITVVRYFTVYGPAGRPDMSLFRFVQWVAEGRRLILYGDGHQSRDFTYVDDIARGTIACLPLKGFTTVNLGSDKPRELGDALAVIEKLLRKRAVLEHRPMPRADVRATWADISRARELLGWEPRVSLDQGLERLVAWYLENRSWASRVVTGD
jgi:nucleoside-diphosphate-sugar epimerase